MNNEIKEILDKLNNGKWEKDTEEINYKILFSNEVYRLLDYITNLQKTNKNHSKKLIELGDKITNLQKENERLKEENNNKAMNDYAHAIDESWYRELYDDYKSRCEKAIEYIKAIQEHRQGLTVIEYHKKWLEMYDYYESASIMADLLNILQNGSDSQ